MPYFPRASAHGSNVFMDVFARSHENGSALRRWSPLRLAVIGSFITLFLFFPFPAHALADDAVTNENLLALPAPGHHQLRILAPTLLELTLITTKAPDPAKVEQELMKLVPREQWTLFSHWLIWHGRRRCSARKPDCAGCEIARLCPSAGKC